MTDNPFVHVIYTFVALCVDNISTIAAIILMTLQFVVIAPKAWRQIKKWRGKNE